jgi:hypothetical protein
LAFVGRALHVLKTSIDLHHVQKVSLDLSNDGFDSGRPGWRDYCASGTMLNFYGAVVSFD